MSNYNEKAILKNESENSKSTEIALYKKLVAAVFQDLLSSFIKTQYLMVLPSMRKNFIDFITFFCSSLKDCIVAFQHYDEIVFPPKFQL